MALTIYHNPRCSKSRQTLEIIRNAGLEPKIVLYLQDPPSAGTLLDIAARLGLKVSDLVRRGEPAFSSARDLPDVENDAALAAWLTAHPICIERPLVVDAERGAAVIGRPPENVAELL